MDEDFRKAALDYHRLPRPGKLAIEPTKRMATQRDLALAYSPGVAAACEAIAADPDAAWELTARGNMVAVVTNGTAVLGLGAIGALASKPVMEGKAVLFKKFAGIDFIDIEVDERDPKRLIEVVAALEPSFGAINLEDIKAPECFEVERTLAGADAHPGLPRRPARHRHHRRRRGAERADPAGQEAVGGQAGEHRRRRRGAGLPRPARGARPPAREHHRLRHRGRGLPGPHQRHGPLQGPLRPRRRRRGGWRRCWRAPTSSSASPPRACSSPNGCRSSRRSRWCWRWPTPTRRSCPRRCAPPAPTPSWRPAAATTRTRSTTSSASPSSSAARWTWARRPSTRR